MERSTSTTVENIKHSPTPSQINIKSHIKVLFTLVSIISHVEVMFNIEEQKQTKTNNYKACEKAKKNHLKRKIKHCNHIQM